MSMGIGLRRLPIRPSQSCRCFSALDLRLTASSASPSWPVLARGLWAHRLQCLLNVGQEFRASAAHCELQLINTGC